MPKELKLTLKLPQSVNHIYGRNRFGSVYLKSEGKKYKETSIDYIKDQASLQEWIKLEKGQFCYLDEVIYMNSKGRDADNLKKLLQDSLTESQVVWYDDEYCLPRTNRIYIDSKNPRVELTITATEFKGIFNTSKEAEDFINKCKTCRRFNRNCSLLKDALDNKILPEFTNENDVWDCKEHKINKAKK